MLKYLTISLYIEHLIIFWYYSLIWSIKNIRNFDIFKGAEAVQFAIFIQIIIMPITGYIFYLNYDQLDKDYILSFPEFSFYELKQWLFMFFWEDFLFYHIHRLFHTQFFYPMHKLHHTWIRPVPWSSLYASIPENLFSNIFPVLSAPIIVGLKIHYVFVWVAIATLASLSAHTPKTSHSQHHKYFNVNFGVTPFFDILYGTRQTPSI